MENERLGPLQIDETLKWLSSILPSSEKRRALLELKGSHAQSLIDFLNSLFLDSDFMTLAEPGLRKYTLITLRKLCENSALYPESYVLNSIENISFQNSEGGFGDIYQGHYKGRVLCLKVVRLFQKVRHEILKAYAREAILWSQLDHPNIAPFYGIFYLDEARQRICLISPWMENGNIVLYLDRNRRAPRKPFIYDIASGLKYLHDENIVHGDLKGLNVLVNEFERACIADFGLSTVLTNKTLAFTSATVFGRTNRWASPELLEDGSRPTCESDVWAFGCVCYEVLTRLLPFEECSTDIQVIRKVLRGDLPARPGGATELGPFDEVDEKMWTLMNRCWSIEVGMRPTCREILQAIESDPSIWEFRYAQTKGFGQEMRQFQHAMRQSSTIQIDLNQAKQILERLSGSRGEPGTWKKGQENWGAPNGDSNFHQESNVTVESSPNARSVLGSVSTHSNASSPSPSPLAQTHFSSKTVDSPAGANYSFPDTLDIYTVPPDLKKQGSDWFVVFNPSINKQLDVALMYISAYDDSVQHVRFSADGKYLAMGCGNMVRIYDAKLGQETCVLTQGSDTMSCLCVCLSPDGRMIATGGDDGRIRIWHVATKSIRQAFDGGDQTWINSLDFSSDGRLLVSAFGDQTAKIWNMTNGSSKVLRDSDVIKSAIFSPNGEYVATGGYSNVIRVWSVETGQPVVTLHGHTNRVSDIAFTPDGKGLVSSSLDKTMKLWDVSMLGNEPGAVVTKDWDERSFCITTFTGHKSYVLHVGVSHDGKWVISGSADGSVQFWDAKSGVVQCMLQPGSRKFIDAMDVSPKGNIFATRSVGEQVRTWSYDTMKYR